MLRHNQKDFTYEIQDVSRHHVSSSANKKVAIRSLLVKLGKTASGKSRKVDSRVDHKWGNISNEVLDLRRERFYHQRKARETRSRYQWQKYKKLCNHINRMERKLKSDYFSRMIKENRNDSSRM